MKRRACIAFLSVWAAISLEMAAQTPALWIDVPFVAQTKEGCGSAAISMVMQYWAKQNGQAASPAMDAGKIQELLYSPSQKGIPARAMERYFRQAGYRTFPFRGEWADLQRHLSQGRPLIVSLKASGRSGPLHYAVVVGLDAERGFVFLNDPAMGKMLRISREGFEAEWVPAKSWTLLAVPAADR